MDKFLLVYIGLAAILVLGLVFIPAYTKKINWRNWKIFASSPEAVKLSRYEQEIVELVGRKKQLEIDIQNNEAQKSAMKLEYEAKLREERAKFEIEKMQIQSRMNIEQEALKAAIEIQKKELLALKNLEVQKIRQEADIRIMSVETEALKKYETKLAEERTRILTNHENWIKENYEKLTNSMQTLHEKGNHVTQFVQSMAGKMLEHVPNVNRLNLDVGQNQPRERVTVQHEDDGVIAGESKPA